MNTPVRRYLRPASGWEPDALLQREWLVTNGLGGYASSTLGCVDTRFYHGMLIAAVPAPFGRLLLLKQIAEQLELADGRRILLSEGSPALHEPKIPGEEHLSEFSLEAGLPVWRFTLPDGMLEKQIFMTHRQNTVYSIYRLLRGKNAVRLLLRPWIQFRAYDNPAAPGSPSHYTLRVTDDRYEIAANDDYPALRLLPCGEHSRFVVDGGTRKEIFLRAEAERGYEAQGALWSPGYFVLELAPGERAAIVASCEPWNAVVALRPEEACEYEHERRRRLMDIADPRLRESPFAELVLAADQFLMTPIGRVRDAIRANANGDQVRSVIAGYHWFSDWGRDTMISLEGLTLVTGRQLEAGWILRTFSHYVCDGLIPNMFPEGREEGLYHTADATLWFFHALDRYVTTTGDALTLKLLLPLLRDIVDHHIKGTRFGIAVDPQDGLLRQGAEGYQLTWMDAKVDDWVVTPRRGKAVELNALWYNALCLLGKWVEQEEGAAAAASIKKQAETVRRSFNERFWYGDGGYLYDVIDGEHGVDAACRPNQLFAVALPHPVLERLRWEPVLDVVQKFLLTPVGLRSLAPGHPSYKPRYYGDLRARDAAYHQGTVWAWLIGPFIDAWLKVHPDDRAGARRFLQGFVPHLNEACIGSISEIFDAEEPFTPRGCISQAWSVAEVLRSWVKTS